MKLILGLIIAAVAAAQTPATIQTRGCRGNAVQIVVSVPLAAGEITVPVPVCAELGTGLTLNTAVNPPRLEATAAPVALPRVVVQRFALPTALPPDTKSISVNLTYTPTASAAILVAFRSSRMGGDVVDFLTPGGGASPKLLQVTVPDYRPFTVDDQLTVMYWTTDAP